ncbi:hypothetical protein [Actinophytocola sp.]|uniref:hypothetical protein n=1 Tax=Actinophytocola sp. TaxID=1872138 RepID=UPI002D398D1E|nr:hypothetical protein [Actinophytocola sp.]HYQ61623.1 hypothetical protein [Actinophytocola sp.]
MTGQQGGFRQAAARFSAEVQWALTRARRAARDAKAESAGFRQRTEELATQAKKKALRRGQATPTSPAARADATKFRTDNGLPVPDLPEADELTGRPNRPPARQENDDTSEITVLFDVDTEPTRPGPEPVVEPVEEPVPGPTRPRDREDDFSQQRILMDATEETYRPDEILDSVFDTDDPRNRR